MINDEIKTQIGSSHLSATFLNVDLYTLALLHFHLEATLI